MRELLWPAFRDGDLSLNHQTFVHNSADVEHLRARRRPARGLESRRDRRTTRPCQPAAARAVWLAASVAFCCCDRAVRTNPEDRPVRQRRSQPALPRRYRRALAPPADVLEIGTGTGGMLRALAGSRVARARRRDQSAAHRRGAAMVWRPAGHHRDRRRRCPFPMAPSMSCSASTSSSTSATATRISTRSHRVLRPGGRYLVQTPNKWPNAVFETIRWRSSTRWRDDHCSLHTPGKLRRRLEAHGFVVPLLRRPRGQRLLQGEGAPPSRMARDTAAGHGQPRPPAGRMANESLCGGDQTFLAAIVAVRTRSFDRPLMGTRP